MPGRGHRQIFGEAFDQPKQRCFDKIEMIAERRGQGHASTEIDSKNVGEQWPRARAVANKKPVAQHKRVYARP
jgi:hypothetical protein